MIGFDDDDPSVVLGDSDISTDGVATASAVAAETVQMSIGLPSLDRRHIFEEATAVALATEA